DLIAVSGGYIQADSGAYQHFLYRNDGDRFVAEALPLPPFPASVVKMGDMDQDGDMDLFVGARVRRDEFPYAPASYVLKNEGGTFSAQAFQLGMVTDAAWSDVDGDGFQDLLVTREWNHLAWLKNDQGKQFSLEERTDVQGHQGLWASIIAWDLDGDGDDDYLLGNLGENHRFQVSEAHPMRLYAVDVDQNGTIDPITTSYWEDDLGELQEFPVNYMDELAAQSPYFRKVFNNYTDFSQAPIDRIITPEMEAAGAVFMVNTSSHYLLRNNGGQLIWERLPTEAQVAPLREMLVVDVNGDQLPDVVLGGNDHAHDVSTGYYEANKGQVLLNEGEGAYRMLLPAQSGLLLSGQVQTLLYFPGDTALLVAGINRQPLAVYQINLPPVQ
ncbi:MAG: FG-GAP-like repeat-containing protein, partial [Bacteroidota bacterium]